MCKVFCSGILFQVGFLQKYSVLVGIAIMFKCLRVDINSVKKFVKIVVLSWQLTDVYSIYDEFYKNRIFTR